MAYAWPHNNKQQVLAEFQAHIAADELKAGTYGDMEDGQWRGCAVGCLTGGRNHEMYPSLYGIPEQLAYLHDATFEGSSRDDAHEGQQWSYRFLEVIVEGADLTACFSRIVIRLFEDSEYGMLRLYPDNEHKSALVHIVELHKRIDAGGIVSEFEWADAAYAADKIGFWQWFSGVVLDVLATAPLGVSE